MFKYINILLDDAAVSFCHYDVKKQARPIPQEILNKGIRFAMKENLNIQFVYPNCELPDYVEGEINQIDHVKIGKEDVIVYDAWPDEFALDKVCVLRLAKDELLSRALPERLPIRLNIAMTDVESFKEKDFERYKKWLECGAQRQKQSSGQINILSDRISLDKMNNLNQ